MINVAHVTVNETPDGRPRNGRVTSEMRGYTRVEYVGNFVRFVWMEAGEIKEAVAFPSRLVVEVTETREET